MEEEEGLDEPLEDVDEVVEAADVGEFMGEDDFDLVACQAGVSERGSRTIGRRRPTTVGTRTSWQ